jgi:primosomal protein N' (replication factor Y)
MIILKIALPTPLHRLFDYQSDVPIAIGSRVQVPFGRQHLIGIVVEHPIRTDCPLNKLKSINQTFDEEPVFSSSLLSLCQWASDYYHHPLGEVLESAMPALLKQGEPASMPIELYWQLNTAGYAVDLQQLKRAPKQIALLALLKQHPEGLSVTQLKENHITASTLQAVKEKAWIEAYNKEKNKKINCFSTQKTDIKLNQDQHHAIETIKSKINQFETFLLYGITGSGKTEVYLRIIEEVLQNNQQALVMVPEISLTPQTIERFQQRFGNSIIAMHSKLNDRERLDAWLLAKNNQVKIIIGTRSAIFAPLKNLGVIIIDEEHDLSYKQQDGFRYSARDLAIRRAQMENIPIILGSATPSLESFLNAENKRYELLCLPERAGIATIPQYQTIDIRAQPVENGLSLTLLNQIKQHLAKKNQVLLFLNRRGFAPTILCHQCGWIADCQHCHAHFVLHQQTKRLHCHHCARSRPLPTQCPDCKSREIHTIGVGTERVEESLKKHFPHEKIIRIDRDTVQRKHAFKNMLKDIHDGEPKILVGTQMLAKGHHFPDVTLVGIIDADGGFFSGDFRAIERMGQLILQVSGRAGREGKTGEVMIQTHHPHHPLLQILLHQDYLSFAKELLKERTTCDLPPFSYHVMLRAESKVEQAAENFLLDIKKLAVTLNKENRIELLGPIPSPMAKRAGRYRAQLLLQTHHRASLHIFLKELINKIEGTKLARSRDLRWSIDVDPQEMF